VREVPLERVETVLARERKDQHDVYARLSEIRVEVREDPLVPLEDRYRLRLRQGGRERRLALLPTAIRQLSGLAGIPVQFLDRVPAALGLKLVRCLLQVADDGQDRPLLLRLKGWREARVRAVLPSSYVRFDDRHLLDELRAVVDEREVTVGRLAVDDDLLFVRLLFRDHLELGPGHRSDPGRIGLDLVNSETGVHPLELRNVVVRLVCANGMTAVSNAQQALRRRHTGVDADAFRIAVRRALTEALATGRTFTDRLVEAHRQDVPDPRQEVAEIFRTHRLGSPRGRLARWVMAEVLRAENLFGVQRWDICQAFTAVARDLEHRDRMRFEDAMGAYLLEGTRPRQRERLN
jgi:hypothetical protein